MPPQLRLNAVAFISSQNHPILIRTFTQSKQDELKYHYIAHTSLDVIEERSTTTPRSVECYLGLLYVIEDVAVYGYITPTKTKIILVLALSDAVVKDAEVITMMKAFHTAYRHSAANPFLRLHAPSDTVNDHASSLLAGSAQWKGFRRRVDDVAKATGAVMMSPSIA